MNRHTRLTLIGMTLVVFMALMMAEVDLVRADRPTAAIGAARVSKSSRQVRELGPDWPGLLQPPTTKCKAENTAADSQDRHGVISKG